ncbi:MAG TPA: ThuA domain-containing protein, partial [Candidatus Saccharimonadales bacterium]|nr:ThuA domain-containing protein [Candidatus Saccharimonadales bacterium]
MNSSIACDAVRWMGRFASRFAFLALALPAFSAPPAHRADSSPLRVLILSGEGNHDWRSTSAFLRQLLVGSKQFDVRVSESPAGLGEQAFASFDLVVLECPAASLGSQTEQTLESFVNAGHGLVVTRAGLLPRAAPGSGSASAEQFRNFLGVTAPPTSVAGHEASLRLFELELALPNHPILTGLSNKLRTADVALPGLAFRPKSEVLARSDHDEPLLLTAIRGKGRVFVTALGCDLAAMQEKAFITTFLRGAEWAGSGQVSLPPSLGLPGPGTNGVRVLIIAGGHDHEAAFYGLFDGYPDLGWPAVLDSKLAFQQDLRPKYDVLVFYDFTRDLDEKGRKNLRDFVESGKGILVLHHGILNFQKWPWWYEEVVGGLYRLERQGSIPNSTVKFGEEHWITPAGHHPITAGIGPFHVTDETYKGLFIATNIQPLLFTDNPTSDRTVAWIGPCTTSKVVFIQLGHDHSPFRHPSYRALVHNSVLWTAGEL